MPNSYFAFKQFTVHQDRCAMKVTTDACVFGAWAANVIQTLSTSPIHLLDLGTGSGLLSLMIAQKNCADIDAIDIDAAAAKQAKENIVVSPWKKQITVIQQNVLQWQPLRLYDVIIANPPFYENELKSEKQAKNVAHHDEGLKLGDIFHFIRTHLKPNGHFFLLLPQKRRAETEGLFAANELYPVQKILLQQTPGHSPFRTMFCGSCRKAEETAVSTLTIKNENGEYTPAFVSLLKDYYLHL